MFPRRPARQQAHNGHSPSQLLSKPKSIYHATRSKTDMADIEAGYLTHNEAFMLEALHPSRNAQNLQPNTRINTTAITPRFESQMGKQNGLNEPKFNMNGSNGQNGQNQIHHNDSIPSPHPSQNPKTLTNQSLSRDISPGSILTSRLEEAIVRFRASTSLDSYYTPPIRHPHPSPSLTSPATPVSIPTSLNSHSVQANLEKNGVDNVINQTRIPSTHKAPLRQKDPNRLSRLRTKGSSTVLNTRIKSLDPKPKSTQSQAALSRDKVQGLRRSGIGAERDMDGFREQFKRMVGSLRPSQKGQNGPKLTPNEEYRQYLAKNHPNMQLEEGYMEGISLGQRMKHETLKMKKNLKETAQTIFKKGKRASTYLLGLILLNEVRVMFQYDLEQYCAAYGFGNEADSFQNLPISSSYSPIGSPQSSRNVLRNYDYDGHLGTTLDVVMYLVARFDHFITTFNHQDYISQFFSYLYDPQHQFSSNLHSTIFFWADAGDRALEHAVTRLFDPIELVRGATFLPQFTPNENTDPQGTNEAWFGEHEEEIDISAGNVDNRGKKKMSDGQLLWIHSIPSERTYFHHRYFRFPFLIPTIRIDEDLIWAPARLHFFWPMTIARWVKEIVYKIALPVIDTVEWIAWHPQRYMAQRIADVFFFFDAKVAYHTRNFVQDAILSRYNFPLIEQLDHMRRANHSNFDISLFLLTYIGSAAKESYRIIDKNMPKLTESDIDLAISELEVELRALQNTSQSEIELFAEHYRIYADNLPVYFNERLRPFLTRLSEHPYDPLYKYFVFTYDKPKSGVKPLDKNELLVLERVPTPAALLKLLTKWQKRMLNLKLPFETWTEHDKKMPQNFVQGFENAFSANFASMTKFLLATAILSKIPPFQRFFYRHLTLSYENRYKFYTYVTSTFSSMSLITATLSIFVMSCVFEVYSQMWGKKHFLSICVGSALCINMATQLTQLTLAKALLSINIHRPALLAPQNGIFPLITMFWAYTTKAYPEGDLRFFYFPVGSRVDALVSGWLFLDILGFFVFTLIFNRRTGLPHLSNIFGFAAGLWMYSYHCKKYGVKPGEDYNLISPESTLPHVNENVPDSLIFFNVFATPLSREFKMKRQMWLEKNDLKRLRFSRNKNFNQDVQVNNFIEGWNLLYRYSQHRDFVAVEENLNKLRQLRQEWRANMGDEDVKREVELGIEDKNIPYMIHTARFAQRQLERLQHIVDQAWSAETGLITPKEWADREYEQFRSVGPKHSLEHAESPLNYNRMFEGRRWGFSMKLFPDGDEDVMYESYIPARPLLRSLDQWMEWSDTRGVMNWSASNWQIFMLQPHLFPRMSERQKRWFHPQDQWYELDYQSLKNLKSRRYNIEWYPERKLSTIWGGPKPPKYDKEGIFNRHEMQMYKFARDPAIREGMINAYGFSEMHQHPGRLWKGMERRRLAHKHWTFPNFKKDWSIAWSNRPKIHKKNEWFPRKNEWDVMDDFDLEQPLYMHGELNPFINNLAGVRQERLVKPKSKHRHVYNAEPRQWAMFERKLWSHIPFKQRPIRRFQMTRPFNMVKGELDMQLDDPHRQIWSKQSRYRPKGARFVAAAKANMEDHVKGNILQTQQFWGVQRRGLNTFQNTFDKRNNWLEESDEQSYKVDWDWQPFAMPRPRF